MNLQIRHPKARELARQVAERDGISLTNAVIKALEAEAARRNSQETIEETIERVHADLVRIGKPGGRVMTKEEIDEMWGHPPEDD